MKSFVCTEHQVNHECHCACNGTLTCVRTHYHLVRAGGVWGVGRGGGQVVAVAAVPMGHGKLHGSSLWLGPLPDRSAP